MNNFSEIKHYLILLGLIFIAIPTISSVIFLNNESAYLDDSDFSDYNLEFYHSSNEKYDLIPTKSKNFNNPWITKNYKTNSKEDKTIFSKLEKLTVHTADVDFRIKGKANSFEAKNSFEEKYNGLSSTFFGNRKLEANYGTNNIYLYDESKLVIFTIAANDYFVFEFSLPNGYEMTRDERVELGKLTESLQYDRTCELENRWYMNISLGITVSTTLQNTSNACKK